MHDFRRDFLGNVKMVIKCKHFGRNLYRIKQYCTGVVVFIKE